ncbi:nuclear transport factor 2 family protein [Nocardia sp. SSK8]|uniref:nuclear transport factor 2 family protein n=1 Tax=Nocardia sp. SSK8 TaxID=3120154 RepID=UPI00300A1495
MPLTTIELDADTATVRAHDLAVYLLDDKTEAIAAAIHRYHARTPHGWRFDHLEVTPVALTEPLARAL